MTTHSLGSTISRAAVFTAALLAGASLASAAFVSDPNPTVTWDSPTQVTLFKDLNGFAQFGALDNAADLLSSGDSTTWNFDLVAAGINPASVTSATLSLSAALDTSAINKTDYYLGISTPVSIGAIYPGTVFNHGAPSSGPFNNWSSVSPFLSFTPGTFPSLMTVGGSANMLSPANGPADYIAIDSLTLTLTVAPVPEPGTTVAGLGALLAVAAAVGRRVRR